MRLKSILGLMVCAIPHTLWAFSCNVTLAKDSCWINYDVTVDVVDSSNRMVLTTLVIPSGKAWARQEISCEPSQKLMYEARFQPSFWKNQENKTYRSSKFLSLPAEVRAKEASWLITACFPNDFAEVPIPPEASGNCACDFASIPAVQPK